MFICGTRKTFSETLAAISLILILVFSLAFTPVAVYAQNNGYRGLPPPGQLVVTSEVFRPALIKGMTIHPENPLLFDFIVDPGDSQLSGQALHEETLKMVKYFLASLTVPDDQVWVNLSPHESNRVISQGLSETEMGRDLLAQDYLLKQAAASLGYPQSPLGQKFWETIYQRAREHLGMTNIPINTFNKVWIAPREASVYEHGQSVFVVSRDLRVMLEEDYLAWEAAWKQSQASPTAIAETRATKARDISSQVVRETIIPVLEKEVNTGRNFANLRQIYNAMILAKWYKDNLKQTLLGQVYAGQNKTRGIENDDPQMAERIYQQYIEAFRRGVYNIVQEDVDPATEEIIPRQYFSGGLGNVRKVEGITDREALSPGQEQELPQEESAKKFTISLLDLGPQAVYGAVEDVAKKTAQAQREFAVDFADNAIKGILEAAKDPQRPVAVNVSLESIIPELGKEGNDPYAQKSLGAGGLGFLDAETVRKMKSHFKQFFGIAILPLYERYYRNNEIYTIDWNNQQDIMPILIKGRDGRPRPMIFKVNFNGNYTTEPNGSNYDVMPYWVNNNGTLQIGLRVPNTKIFDHLYPDGQADKFIQYGFMARAVVEFLKAINLSPDIMRLNESQMAFVYSAMQNDIEHYEAKKEYYGRESIFAHTKILFTSHTAELAAVPIESNLEELKWRVGWDLLRGDILTEENGRVYFNGIKALARHADVTNTVSEEHKAVTSRLLLKEHPKEKLTYVDNGSDAEIYRPDKLNNLIRELGLAGVTGRDLFEIGFEEKMTLNDFLRNRYGESTPVFDDLTRPLFGLLRRGVEYKEAGILLDLAEWITGDRDVDYYFDGINLGKGLGANLVIGGQGQDTVGREWIRGFKKLQQDPRMKGKLVYVEDTGIEVMRKVSASIDVWHNVPDPTREGAGTSQMRVAFGGKQVIAVMGAAFDIQIIDGINGWVINAFPELSRDQLIDAFDPLNNGGQVIAGSRKEFRRRLIPLLAKAYSEAADLYYDYREGKDKRWEERMRHAYRIAHDTVTVERTVRDYELLMLSMLDGSDVEGFDKKRQDITRLDLLTRILKWYPDLQSKRFTLPEIQAYIQELWTPLDTMVLGEEEKVSLTTNEGYLLEVLNRFQVKADPGQGVELSRIEEADGAGEEEIDAGGRKSVGGINLNPAWLDLQVRRDEEGMALPMPLQPIENLNVEGFLPVIINVVPAVDLPFLLGETGKEEPPGSELARLSTL